MNPKIEVVAEFCVHFRYPYGENMQCDWKIVVSSGSTISVVIVDLELEDHYNCYFDYLEVRIAFYIRYSDRVNKIMVCRYSMDRMLQLNRLVNTVTRITRFNWNRQPTRCTFVWYQM